MMDALNTVSRVDTLVRNCIIRGTEQTYVEGRRVEEKKLRKLHSNLFVICSSTSIFDFDHYFCCKLSDMVPKQRIVPSVPKENVVIQAVLIADSFETHFDVITQDRPKALIPFLNQPLIDYSLGLLRYNGVQEVFLYCCHLQKQVRDHVKNVWCDSGEMVVHVFSSGMYQSTGDVFRGG